MESNLLKGCQVELEISSHFWKTLFLSEKLASKLTELAAKNELVTFHLPEYGKIQLELKKATDIGDNFMSDTCCCYATTENGKQFQAFTKVAPKNILLRATAFSQRLYFREIHVYQHLLRYLREIRCKYGLTEQDLPLNVPEGYFCHLEEPAVGEKDGNETVIVLEELKWKGFRMANKFMGCHFHEAKLTLKSLAYFHALTICYLRSLKDSSGNYAVPDTLQYIHQRIEFEEKMADNFKLSLPIYLETMRIMGHNEAADWLENQAQNVETVMESEKIGQSGPLSCILHADCWNNNMLYRYNDEGYAVETRLVDWQITRFGHPASDILHFLFSSTSPEMRDEHFDNLLTIYYKTLKTGLAKLDIDIEGEGYSEEIFRKEVKQRYLWGMFLTLFILPVIVDKKIISTMEEFENSEKDQFKDMNFEEVMAESKQKMEQGFNSAFFLSNTLLCHRAIQLVLQVKKALE